MGAAPNTKETDVAAGALTIFGANKAALNIDNLLGATLKLALVKNTYTPSSGTSGHSVWADVSGQEVAAGNGYLAGGVVLASASKTAVGSGFKLSTSNAAWDAAGGNIPAWRYGVIYVAGSLWGKASPLVGYFVGDTTPTDYPATPDGSPLVIATPLSGWFTVA
jgi:hypothetical protein